MENFSQPGECAMDPGPLGEYCQILDEQGLEAARKTFPDVAAHLDEGCPLCEENIPGIIEIIRAFPD